MKVKVLLLLLSIFILLFCSSGKKSKMITPKEFPSAKIYGEVYDEETAKVIPNAKVKLTYLNILPNEKDKYRTVEKEVDENGYYEFKNFYNHKLEIEAISPKYETNSIIIDRKELLDEMGKHKDIAYDFKKDIPLSKKHTTIIGKVVSKDKKEPIPNATVVIQPSTKNTKTDSSGIFSVSLKDIENDLKEGDKISIQVEKISFQSGVVKDYEIRLFEDNIIEDIELTRHNIEENDDFIIINSESTQVTDKNTEKDPDRIVIGGEEDTVRMKF